MLVLFYNSMWGEYPPVEGCRGAHEFICDPGRVAEADLVVFHLPTLGESLRRLPKRRGQLWAAWCLESEVNTPWLARRRSRRRFDLTATYQRWADAWIPYLRPGDLPALMAPPAEKTAPAPVARFQSHGFDRSGRNALGLELMKRIKVASYGHVAPTVPEPGAIRSRAERLAVCAGHKFTLAFENSIATDYVTEKFFDPLCAGSVPVYLGAPNVREFAPAARSYIDVRDFASPDELARYLTHLDLHEAEYAEYLRWKRDGPDPSFLALLDSIPREPYCGLVALAAERLGRAASPVPGGAG